MKKLLILIVAACFCLAPAVTLAGNLDPHFYLEIYMEEMDPDDPGPPPGYLCYHTAPPGVPGDPCPAIPGGTPELQCFSPKAPYNFGIVPIHVGHLWTPPLAEGWPLPAGPGGGWVLVSLGIQRTGIAVTYVGITMCPNFLQGPGTAPGAILATATTKCHDWCDHPCYVKYMSTTNMGATYFTIIGNLEDGNTIDLINCQAISERPILTGIGNQAQWGGTKTLTCPQFGWTAVDLTTWGAIKGLYR